MNAQKKNFISENPSHEYVCKNLVTGTVYRSPKLPLILKMLRIETGYTFKIPHGNKVRTLILEQGVCRIDYPDHHYEITIERW